MSPLDLDDLLHRCAEDASGMVYVQAAWIERVPSVPVDAGLPGIVRFADSCWKRLLTHMLAAAKTDDQLAIAEAALTDALTEGAITKNILIALAAVQAARAKL